jgi:hypothetical protein
MRDVTRYASSVHQLPCPAVPWSPFSSPRGVTVTLLITSKDRQLSCSGQELHHSEIRFHQSAAPCVIYKLKPSFGSVSTKDHDTQRSSIRLRSRMALQVFSHCKLFRHSSTVRSALIPLCGESSMPQAGFQSLRYGLMIYWLDKVSALRTVIGVTE